MNYKRLKWSAHAITSLTDLSRSLLRFKIYYQLFNPISRYYCFYWFLSCFDKSKIFMLFIFILSTGLVCLRFILQSLFPDWNVLVHIFVFYGFWKLQMSAKEDLCYSVLMLAATIFHIFLHNVPSIWSPITFKSRLVLLLHTYMIYPYDFCNQGFHVNSFWRSNIYWLIEFSVTLHLLFNLLA